MTETAEAPDALLIWGKDMRGASIVVPVTETSVPGGPQAFVRAAIDEATGLGLLERADGSRLLLTEMDPGLVREALAMDAVVVVELSDDGRVQHPVRAEAPDVAPAPGM